MSFRSAAYALFFFLFFSLTSARASFFGDVFLCWIPVFFGGRTPPLAVSINSNALEAPLQSRARQFLPQQIVIADLARHHFGEGTKLRDLLEQSREALDAILVEFPPGDPSFQEKFGKKREQSETLPFYGSARLPRMAIEQMEFRHQAARPLLLKRLLEEMGPPPRTFEQEIFLDKLWAVRSGNYYFLDRTSVSALFCFLGGTVDSGDDSYYLSFPERAVIDVILTDAETRLEIARKSSSLRVRKEQFFAALYGYVVSRPYRAGNQTIGWPVFAGIYQALTGDPLPGIYGRDDLSRMATLSQSWFIENVGQEIERRRRRVAVRR